MSLSYSGYLKLEELLSLQQPLADEAEHDELLFIVIHQAYELWFKEVLHEIDHLEGLLRDGDTPRALNTFKRILTILKVLVHQVDILETMTPVEFLAFRDRLETASGSESYQFRALEFRLGVKRRDVLEDFSPGTVGRRVLEERLEAPTLWDAFTRYLSDSGYAVPDEVLGRDVRAAVEPSESMQEILLEVYREDPETTQVCERLADLDEGVQEWRYRHLKVVERTIGRKPGTGGTTGVRYLMTTLLKPAFPDLWEIRTEL